jgi:cell surface protein SprA
MASRITTEYTNHGDPTYNGYNLNSSDVLVPAFLAAYTNRSPNKSPLDLFPAILNMLPNWRITYNGLSNIEFIKKYFRSVNLTHTYRCTYNVGSYNSLLSWAPGANGYYGYTNDITTNSNTILSSQYDVGTVTITESFSPLLGIDVTTQNNISFKVEYKRGRTLSLSIASTQVVESSNYEWVFGAGYKIKDFNTILRIKQRQSTVSNDLTLRGDVSIKDIKAIIRKIEEDYSQPTSGSKALTIRMTADYVFSEKVNIGLYFDRMSNAPFISSSYPTVSTDFGVTFRFMLTR